MLSTGARATPAEDFTARGRALLANKEKLSEADRLHRLFDFSWEYTMKESPEFHDEVLKNGALPMSVLEIHIQEWVANRRSA